MALNQRQLRAYQDTASIVRPQGTVVSQRRGDDAYTLVANDVPCHYDFTQNDDEASAAGRLKNRLMITEDNIHFEASVDVRSQDLICRTTGGSPQGWHRVEGAPRKPVGAPWRPTNHLIVRAMEEEKPPAGAVALV